jgi:hypothetical protein
MLDIRLTVMRTAYLNNLRLARCGSCTKAVHHLWLSSPLWHRCLTPLFTTQLPFVAYATSPTNHQKLYYGGGGDITISATSNPSLQLQQLRTPLLATHNSAESPRGKASPMRDAQHPYARRCPAPRPKQAWELNPYTSLVCYSSALLTRFAPAHSVTWICAQGQPEQPALLTLCFRLSLYIRCSLSCPPCLRLPSWTQSALLDPARAPHASVSSHISAPCWTLSYTASARLPFIASLHISSTLPALHRLPTPMLCAGRA